LSTYAVPPAPISELTEAATLRRIRLLLALFATGLLLSGLTAFPLANELRLLEQSLAGAEQTALYSWIHFVHEGLTRSYRDYPFLAYGTDWLGFAHIVIALAFWGPYRDPVRNRWVVEWGMASCLLVLPLALICGPLRGIPLYWRLIDCSFGVIGILPLWLVRRLIIKLERNVSGQ
jgi:hypothetical protein